jgi:hypothetical protein
MTSILKTKFPSWNDVAAAEFCTCGAVIKVEFGEGGSLTPLQLQCTGNGILRSFPACPFCSLPEFLPKTGVLDLILPKALAREAAAELLARGILGRGRIMLPNEGHDGR